MTTFWSMFGENDQLSFYFFFYQHLWWELVPSRNWYICICAEKYSKFAHRVSEQGFWDCFVNAGANNSCIGKVRSILANNNFFELLSLCRQNNLWIDKQEVWSIKQEASYWQLPSWNCCLHACRIQMRLEVGYIEICSSTSTSSCLWLVI